MRHCTCRPVALLGMVLYTIWCIYAAGAALRFMVNMVYLELTCRTHRLASFVVSAIRNITFLTYLVHYATHATAGVVTHWRVCVLSGAGLGGAGCAMGRLSHCCLPVAAPLCCHGRRDLYRPRCRFHRLLAHSVGVHACMLSSVW